MKKTLLTLISFILSNLTLSAQVWTNISPPINLSYNEDGFDIIEFKGDLFYAGNGGVYKSANKGLNWTYSSNGLNTFALSNIQGITSNSYGVFIASDSSVFKSADGSLWEPTSWNPAVEGHYFSEFFTRNDSIFLFDPGKSILYISGDNGNKWTNRKFPSQTFLYAEGYMYTHDYQTFQRTKNGVHFENFPSTGLPSKYLNGLITVEEELFAISESKIYYFNSVGSWSKKMLGDISKREVYEIKYLSNKIYASTDSIMYVSSDKGETWEGIASDGLPTSKIRYLFSITGGFLATPYEGLYYLEDGSNKWARRDSGLNITQSSPTIVTKSAIIHPTLLSGVYRSSDKGKTWEPSNSGLPSQAGVVEMDFDYFHFSTDDKIYVSTKNHDIFRSDDEGVSWTKVSKPSFTSNQYNMIGSVGNTIFLYVYEQENGDNILRSDDNGLSWKNINDRMPPEELLQKLSGNSSNILAISNRYLTDKFTFKVFHSTDAGDTWNEAVNGLEDLDGVGASILLSGSTAFLVSSKTYYSGFKIHKASIDNLVWGEVPLTGLPKDPHIHDLSYDKKNLYVTLLTGEVFQLKNGESVWTDFKNNIYPESVGTLKFQDETVYYCSYFHGLWKNSKEEVPSTPTANTPELGNHEITAYPNPFSQGFTQSSKKENQKILGYEISSPDGKLIKKVSNSRGFVESTIDLSNERPGVYFIKITTAGGKIFSKRLAIIR